ncbi:MAG: sigma 54-interacting transcriptional regulator [Pseudomonadota bacterium]
MNIGNYWKTIVDTLQDGLLVVGPRGDIIAVNPAAERLTGYKAIELIGKNCRILNCTGCEILGKGCEETFCSLYAQGRVRAKKCTITHKSGLAVHILKNASVFHSDQGEVIGAVETLTDMSELIRKQTEIESLRRTLHLDDSYLGMVGRSEVMQRLFDLINNVAQTDAPVMIHGQSGTGKELVARAIHEAGSRKGRPFIKVNCAALNENLLESELFGHVKGAFTGADKDRQGRFEAAHTGTIFIDETGDIPMATQVKLLRVLEEKRIERVGDHASIPADVRIITATNKNLETLIAEGRFREDLYFRINVFPIQVPALSERRDDIPAIVNEFVKRNAAASEKNIVGVTPEAMGILINAAWPGNVRELRNAIEFAFVLCQEGWIDVPHLPPKLLARGGAERDKGRASDDPERRELIGVLKDVGGNQSEAARRLGVSRVTVWKRIRRHDIDLRKDI